MAPEEDEIEALIQNFNIEPDFLRASLDEEESSHIDSEDGNTLIIIDIPVVEKHEKNIRYSTMPLGIMLTEKNVITVCLKETALLSEFAEGVLKGVMTNLKTHFVLHIMLRMATKYLQYLKQIDKISDHVERELRKSMKNQELIQLLDIEKSLVYFSSSLKADEVTLEKIMRGRYIKLYDEDQDLLEDVLIEIKQAIEMSNIYLNILSGTMDAFASVISNNLNIVMKVLASVTIILTIPSIIFGLWGSNVPVPFETSPYGFWIVIAIAVLFTGAAVVWMLKKKWL